MSIIPKKSSPSHQAPQSARELSFSFYCLHEIFGKLLPFLTSMFWKFTHVTVAVVRFYCCLVFNHMSVPPFYQFWIEYVYTSNSDLRCFHFWAIMKNTTINRAIFKNLVSEQQLPSIWMCSLCNPVWSWKSNHYPTHLEKSSKILLSKT